MTTTTIPSKHIINCDICGVVCDHNGNYHLAGKLRRTSTVHDYQGHPVGCNAVEADLCDRCLGDLDRFLNDMKAEYARKD